MEGRDAGGKRDYVQNKPLHAGTLLALFVAGRWLPARYESARYESRDGLIYLDAMVLPLVRQSMRFRWREHQW